MKPEPDDRDLTIMTDEYERAYIRMKNGLVFCLEESMAGELIIYPTVGNNLGLAHLGAGDGKAVVVSQYPIGVMP